MPDVIRQVIHCLSRLNDLSPGIYDVSSWLTRFQNYF